MGFIEKIIGALILPIVIMAVTVPVHQHEWYFPVFPIGSFMLFIATLVLIFKYGGSSNQSSGGHVHNYRDYDPKQNIWRCSCGKWE